MSIKELKCELCGYTYPENDLVSTDKYYNICHGCHDEHYTTCYSCDIKLLKEDAIASEFDDEFYCDNCYDKLFCRCAYCDCLVYREDIYYSDSDCYLCEDCYLAENDIRDSELTEDNPQWHYYRARGEHRNSNTFKNLYIGVELELERVGDISWSKLRNDLCSFHHIKSDGSLDDGVEIINHPATYRYLIQHKELWENIFKMDGDIKPQETCGMHVHLSRNAFEDGSHISRFENFFTANQSFCEAFSERSSGSLQEWASIAYLVDGNDISKGSAINVYPHTVEVRLFASTNIASKFWSNIQFCKAVFELTKAEDADISISAFMNHIECNLHNYIELKSNALSYIKVVGTTV